MLAILYTVSYCCILWEVYNPLGVTHYKIKLPYQASVFITEKKSLQDHKMMIQTILPFKRTRKLVALHTLSRYTLQWGTTPNTMCGPHTKHYHSLQQVSPN